MYPEYETSPLIVTGGNSLGISLSRIPAEGGNEVGEIKQVVDTCLDTLGHSVRGTVGLYKCHNTGGNQVLYTTGNISLYQPFILNI